MGSEFLIYMVLGIAFKPPVKQIVLQIWKATRAMGCESHYPRLVEKRSHLLKVEIWRYSRELGRAFLNYLEMEEMRHRRCI